MRVDDVAGNICIVSDVASNIWQALGSDPQALQRERVRRGAPPRGRAWQILPTTSSTRIFYPRFLS